MAFHNTQENKSLASPASPNSSQFFSSNKIQGLTLKKVASIAMIEQLGSVENVEEFIKQDSALGLYDCMPSILANIKKLHHYVIENNLIAVDEFLNSIPHYLLPVLLKTKSINKTSAKGILNPIVVEGTALMMALGAEAVGRDGCDLCLIPSESPRENTTLKKLKLYSDKDPRSPLRYLIEDKEFIIEPGFADNQLNPDDFATLKDMFVNGSFYNKDINLDYPVLNDLKLKAYAGILRLTQKRGHTKFVNEEGMVELLQRHIKRALAEEGEDEIQKQTLEQFPEGWENREEKRFLADCKMLHKIQKAIIDSSSNTDPKLIAAIQAFKIYFEPAANKILKMGKYGKNRLLLAAFEIGTTMSNTTASKKNLYFNQVVGWLQRLMQVNVKQDMAQGLSRTVNLGKKSSRSLKFTHKRGDFILYEVCRAGVGYDYWIEFFFGKGPMSLSQVPDFGLDTFRSYVQANEAALQKYIPRRDNSPAKRSWCPIM